MATHARIAAAAIMALTALMAAGCTPSDGPAASGPSPHAASSRTAQSGMAQSGAATSGASAGASTAVGEGPIPTFVPRYYVTLDPVHTDRLIVRSTITGSVVATVRAPAHLVFTAVFGTGTGQVFTVDTRQEAATPGGGDDLYLLRLAQGPGTPLPLVPLHAGHSVGPGLTAAALSPDTAKIAIAYTYRTSPPSPQPVILYSTATGAVLRTWTVTSGIISSADPMGNGDLGQDAGGTSLRWTADGRGLAFAFHANAAPGKQGYGYDRLASIRLLDTTAPGGDLIANSRMLVSPGPQYNPGNGAGTQCMVPRGWSVSADGQAVTCAAQWSMPGRPLPASPRLQGCPGPSAASHTPMVAWAPGFWRQYSLPGGGGGAGTVYGPCPAAAPAGAHLIWASSDGNMVLGLLNPGGGAEFGLFSGGSDFIPLAPPPSNIPLASMAW
jgi:hypothetical protein